MYHAASRPHLRAGARGLPAAAENVGDEQQQLPGGREIEPAHLSLDIYQSLQLRLPDACSPRRREIDTRSAACTVGAERGAMEACMPRSRSSSPHGVNGVRSLRLGPRHLTLGLAWDRARQNIDKRNHSACICWRKLHAPTDADVLQALHCVSSLAHSFLLWTSYSFLMFFLCTPRAWLAYAVVSSYPGGTQHPLPAPTLIVMELSSACMYASHLYAAHNAIHAPSADGRGTAVPSTERGPAGGIPTRSGVIGVISGVIRVDISLFPPRISLISPRISLISPQISLISPPTLSL